MKIEVVTVGYGVTQSLAGYCNVKPSISLTASVDEGEDEEQVQAALLERAQAFVHELVDDALEADDLPPRYYDGPRYRVFQTAIAFLIWPQDERLPDDLTEIDRWPRELIGDRRLETCRATVTGHGSALPVFESLAGEIPADLVLLIEDERKRREEEGKHREEEEEVEDWEEEEEEDW